MADLGVSPLSSVTIMTFEASAAITEGRAVMLDSISGKVKHATDGTDAVIGVAAETQATSGGHVKVYLCGPVVQVVANDAVAIGDSVNSAAATGKVDTAGTAERAIGIALEAATAQDDRIAVMLAYHSTEA